MRQILLFAALAASLALLSGCALSRAKEDTAEDMTDKAAYHKISAEEAYEMMVFSTGCKPSFPATISSHRERMKSDFKLNGFSSSE